MWCPWFVALCGSPGSIRTLLCFVNPTSLKSSLMHPSVRPHKGLTLGAFLDGCVPLWAWKPTWWFFSWFPFRSQRGARRTNNNKKNIFSWGLRDRLWLRLAPDPGELLREEVILGRSEVQQGHQRGREGCGVPASSPGEVCKPLRVNWSIQGRSFPEGFSWEAFCKEMLWEGICCLFCGRTSLKRETRKHTERSDCLCSPWGGEISFGSIGGWDWWFWHLTPDSFSPSHQKEREDSWATSKAHHAGVALALWNFSGRKKRRRPWCVGHPGGIRKGFEPTRCFQFQLLSFVFSSGSGMHEQSEYRKSINRDVDGLFLVLDLQWFDLTVPSFLGWRAGQSQRSKDFEIAAAGRSWISWEA